MGFIGLVASGIVAFVCAIVAALFIGTKKDEGKTGFTLKVE